MIPETRQADEPTRRVGVIVNLVADSDVTYPETPGALSGDDAKFVAGVQAGIDAGAYTARGVIIGLLAVIRRLSASLPVSGETRDA